MSETDLKKAAQILKDGGVVGLPTETVYGLAARIDRPDGIQSIFQTKERPFFDPLIVHVHSIEQAYACVSVWPAAAEILTRAFWPGPLTLVLPKSPAISSMITSGLLTVGLRCPRHPVAIELIREVGVPLAAPSANRFGRTSPTQAQHVRDEFHQQVFVLEGGASEVGIESTIIQIEGEVLRLLRPGVLTVDEISAELSEAEVSYRWEEPVGKTQAPGQMKHHYMPEKPLLIFERPPETADWAQVSALMHALPTEVEGVQIRRPEQIQSRHELKFSDSPFLAARELYQKLRETGELSADVLFLVWPLEKRRGPWLALWDRLSKAASLCVSPIEDSH